MINLQNLIRTNIRELISCAETKAEENVRDSQHIMLDANEKQVASMLNKIAESLKESKEEKIDRKK